MVPLVVIKRNRILAKLKKARIIPVALCHAGLLQGHCRLGAYGPGLF